VNNNYNLEVEIIEPRDMRAGMVRAKVCSKCKLKKPASDFSIGTTFRYRKRLDDYVKRTKLNSECKACITKRVTTWRKANVKRNMVYQSKYHRILRRQK
jgi:hypothetical protein